NIELDVALAYLDLLETYGLLAINADILARAEQVLAAAENGAKAGLNKSAADVNRAATEVYLRREEARVLRGPAGVASARLARRLDACGAGNVADLRAGQAALGAVGFRFREVQANVSAEIAEAARTAAARFETLQDAQEAVRQGLEMYRKYRETSFAFLDPKV